MYPLIVASSTAPSVAQKYPRARKSCPQYRLPNSGNSSCSRCDDRPLMYCTNFVGDRQGGTDNSMCMGSGETAPRTVTTSHAAQICRIKSRARSAIHLRITL
jgi:hypothetical protein